MFEPDNPIEDKDDDILDRRGFSKHLGESLLNWREKKSLVIALNGEWGSGKTSIINLAKYYIEKSNHISKPTIIEFNPWNFTEVSNLTEHFFYQIAREIELKCGNEKEERENDRKLAEKFRHYANCFKLVPQTDQRSKIFSNFMLISAFLGSLTIYFDSTFDLLINWISSVISVFVAICILLVFIDNVFSILGNYFSKIGNFFESRSNYKLSSLSEIKEKIINELDGRSRKLIVVIDDIDRLNESEIRQIFRLIRKNANFPNTIYLLAFEKNVVEDILNINNNTIYNNYLDKFIQIYFNVPYLQREYIEKHIYIEIARILSNLPEIPGYDFSDAYWQNIYHPGFSDLFRNFRDIKKFTNSLSFNITKFSSNNSIDFNEIDFVAIESIRVFAQNLYTFMSNNKNIFTSTLQYSNKKEEGNIRRQIIDSVLDNLPNDIRKPILILLKNIFPVVNDIYNHGYVIQDHKKQLEWNREFRVCATDCYESYFTLIPGGDKDVLSRANLVEIMESVNSKIKFSKVLNKYKNTKNFQNVLNVIQNPTRLQLANLIKNRENIIVSLFDVFDDISDFEFGLDGSEISYDLEVIVNMLFSYENEIKENYSIWKKMIDDSAGLFGPIQTISIEISKHNNESNIDSTIPIIHYDNINELKNLCLNKIVNNGNLLNNRQLPYILYKWKCWDSGVDYQSFIDEIINDNEKYLFFINKFFKIKIYDIVNGYKKYTVERFFYQHISHFLDLNEIKMRFEKIKRDHGELYKIYNKLISYFLDNFDKKDTY